MSPHPPVGARLFASKDLVLNVDKSTVNTLMSPSRPQGRGLEMINSQMFIGDLDCPWDADWLATKWPHLFTLLDGMRGTVVVHDVQGVLELARETYMVDLEFDGQGLTLRVFDGTAKLVAA